MLEIVLLGPSDRSLVFVVSHSVKCTFCTKTVFTFISMSSLIYPGSDDSSGHMLYTDRAVKYPEKSFDVEKKGTSMCTRKKKLLVLLGDKKRYNTI